MILHTTKIITLSGTTYETAFVRPEDKVNYQKCFRSTPDGSALKLLKQHCKDNGIERLIVFSASSCVADKEYIIKK